MSKFILAAGAAFALLGLAACDGGAEKSGEKLDSQIENATQGHENAGDGALEQTGEAIDRATGQERQGDPVDAINDATDGKSSTHP